MPGYSDPGTFRVLWILGTTTTSAHAKTTQSDIIRPNHINTVDVFT
jgi:hypothetical protein